MLLSGASRLARLVGTVREAATVESLEAMWAAIEQVVPRNEPAAAIAAVFELTLPLDSDADEAWRSMLSTGSAWSARS